MQVRLSLVVVLLAAAAGCGGSSGGSSSPASSGASVVGSAAAGKLVFGQSGCGNCHTLVAAGTGGTTGPNLTVQAPMDAKRAGMSFAAFVHRSIVDPNAYIAKGFQADIMPKTFGAQLSSQQIADLVALITKP